MEAKNKIKRDPTVVSLTCCKECVGNKVFVPGACVVVQSLLAFATRDTAVLPSLSYRRYEPIKRQHTRITYSEFELRWDRRTDEGTKICIQTGTNLGPLSSR